MTKLRFTGNDRRSFHFLLAFSHCITETTYQIGLKRLAAQVVLCERPRSFTFAMTIFVSKGHRGIGSYTTTFFRLDDLRL